MTDDPPRYRDYLPPGAAPAGGAGPPDEDGPEFQQSAVVMLLRDGSWHAVWQGADGVLGEYTGGRDDAVAWARERCDRCWVYSAELGDVVLLHDPDARGEPSG